MEKQVWLQTSKWMTYIVQWYISENASVKTAAGLYVSLQPLPIAFYRGVIFIARFLVSISFQLWSGEELCAVPKIMAWEQSIRCAPLEGGVLSYENEREKEKSHRYCSPERALPWAASTVSMTYLKCVLKEKLFIITVHSLLVCVCVCVRGKGRFHGEVPSDSLQTTYLP